MIDREALLISLMKYIGIYYRWAGNDPASGLDCSGLIYNILNKDLKIGPTQDLTSQGYYNHFKYQCVSVLPGATDLGDLIFFGKDQSKITHIAMALDQRNMIEAAGGDSSVINQQQALLKGAKVEVNPISRRSDMVAILRPNIVWK